MGLMEELQGFKDKIALGNHKGSGREAFVMTKAINNTMDRPPKDLEGASREDIYSYIVSTAARTDTRKSSESIWGTMDLGFGIPSTAFGEFPRRYQKSGLIKGAKETFEAHTGRRGKLTPVGEQVIMDVAAFGVPAAIRYGMKRGAAGVAQGINKRLTGSFGTSGEAKVGAYRRWMQRRQLAAPITPTAKAGVHYQQPLTPQKHPIFYGTGTSPIEQFERSGGGLIDNLMKRTSVGIEKNIQDAFGKGYSAGEMDVGRKFMGYKLLRQKGRLPDGGDFLKQRVVGSLDQLFADRLRKNLKLTHKTEAHFYANNAKLLSTVKMQTPTQAWKEADRITKAMIKKKVVDSSRLTEADKITKQAQSHPGFKITDDPYEASYITKDGKMLNLGGGGEHEFIVEAFPKIKFADKTEGYSEDAVNWFLTKGHAMRVSAAEDNLIVSMNMGKNIKFADTQWGTLGRMIKETKRRGRIIGDEIYYDINRPGITRGKFERPLEHGFVMSVGALKRTYENLRKSMGYAGLTMTVSIGLQKEH